jgi:hypothetical protein
MLRDPAHRLRSCSNAFGTIFALDEKHPERRA